MLFFDLQKQPNPHDCGLFAIANTMAICNGQSPEGLNYNTKVMRKHLVGCLKIKSSVIFQLAKEVLNRKKKDQKYTVKTLQLLQP